MTTGQTSGSGLHSPRQERGGSEGNLLGCAGRGNCGPRGVAEAIDSTERMISRAMDSETKMKCFYLLGQLKEDTETW